MAGALDDSMASLPNLPTDILLLIFNTLSVRELSALSQTCSFFHDLVRSIYSAWVINDNNNPQISSYGWPMYIRRHPRPSYSVANYFSATCPRSIARYNHLTDQNWQESSFIARPLSRSWSAKQQPTLAINSRRLVIAAGATISCYSFTPGFQPGILDEGSIHLGEPRIQGRNITSVTFLGEDVLLVAYQEGLVEIITLLPSVGGSTSLGFTRRVFSGIIPDTDYVESFSASTTLLLSISSLGSGSLCSLPSEEADEANQVSTVNLCERGWKSYLSSSSGPPGSQDDATPSSYPMFAAFGTSGRIPLTVHSISPSQGLSPTPEFVLHTPKGVDTWHSQLERAKRQASSSRSSPSPITFSSGSTTPSSSTPAPAFDWQTASGSNTDRRLTDRLPNLAAYGITRGPLNSPWGASPQILVSGWFDGQVRIYDMRDSSAACARALASSLTTNGDLGERFRRPTFLKPVLSLYDRWQHEPIYTVACGGGNGSYVAAGAARHGVVAFWDVRRSAGERLSEATTSPQETTDTLAHASVGGYARSVGKTGWSVHAPVNTSDSSPVFDLIMESSRVFGVTDRAGFVLDFVRLFLSLLCTNSAYAGHDKLGPNANTGAIPRRFRTT